MYVLIILRILRIDDRHIWSVACHFENMLIYRFPGKVYQEFIWRLFRNHKYLGKSQKRLHRPIKRWLYSSIAGFDQQHHSLRYRHYSKIHLAKHFLAQNIFIWILFKVGIPQRPLTSKVRRTNCEGLRTISMNSLQNLREGYKSQM